MGPMSVEIRRGATRFTTRAEGRLTRHSYSFGEHYDPDRTGFGPMVCHDDHVLRAGTGFDTHRHADLEILTWVVSGALAHRDSLGTDTVLHAGDSALLSAGSGVEHSEHAVGGAGPTRFVQVWLQPDEQQSAPSYARGAEVPADADGLVDTGLRPAVAGARLLVARPRAGQTLTLPAAPRLHCFVARGALLRSSLAEPLEAGDAFCFTDEPDHDVTAAVDSELLVQLLP